MNDWSAGYVTDIGYTYGYYQELNPVRVRLAFLSAGRMPPETATACELGFGQGLSVNLHAAAGSARWFGTDFNPAHAAFAQDLARAADSGAQLFDQAFAEFCARTDLPYFDFIGLHGIWSWISEENRAILVDFVRRRLKVGGVLYISYNTQPGWAAFQPMRDLLADHTAVMGADGTSIVERIERALAFAERLIAAEPLYAKAFPQVVERLKKIKEQNRHYLAHEYFNRDWEPMSFARMHRTLSAAKLQWVCSAHYLDAVDAVNLTAPHQALLQETANPVFRQTVRDFCVNQQFRRDYWVKGARELPALERIERLRQVRVVLVQPRSDVPLKVKGSLGEATLQEKVYGPVLDALADHKPKTLGHLEQEVRESGVTFPQVVQAALVLCGSGALHLAQDEAAVSKAKKRTDRLNSHLFQLARSRNELVHLACPVTGGGILVPRFHQLFLLARHQGRKEPRDWAAFVWALLEAQGQRIIKEGRALERAEENLAELTRHAEEFATKQLPLLKALHIAS